MALNAKSVLNRDYDAVYVNNQYSDGQGYADANLTDYLHSVFPDKRKITILTHIHNVVVGPGQSVSNNHWKILAKQITKQSGQLGHNDVICLYDGDEGVSVNLLKTFAELMPYLGDNTSQFVYITGAFNSARTHDAVAQQMSLAPITKNMRVFLKNSWELGCSEHAHKNFIVRKDQPKLRDYLCFNRNYRDTRVIFLGLLKHYNLFYKGYVSQGANLDGDELLDDISGWRKEAINGHYEKYWNSQWDSNTLDNMIRGWQAHPQHQIRLHSVQDDDYWSDPESVDYCHATRDNDKTLYESVHYFVITETAFCTTTELPDTVSSDCHFLTEKTYRQIGVRMPFVLLSRPGQLAELRKAGYQTFHPHIDETYDTIENDCERMLAIISEMKRLHQFSESEWQEWHNAVDKITDFNYNILEHKNLEIVEITEEINERFMD